MSSRSFFHSVFILVWLPLFFGCRGLHKVRATERKVTQTTETGTRIIKQNGDSVVYVPKIKFKDTTITRIRRNVVLKTIYNKQGNVDSVICKQKEKQIIENYIKKQEEKSKKITREKEKEPAFKFKDIYFLYIGLTLIILVVINKKI